MTMETLEHLLGICGEAHINLYHIILFFALAYLAGSFLYYITKDGS